jgi:hypothetical protein
MVDGCDLFPDVVGDSFLRDLLLFVISGEEYVEKVIDDFYHPLA